MIVKYGDSEWEIHRCSLDEFMNTLFNDSFYRNITDEAKSDWPFDWIVLGKKDTLFCVDEEKGNAAIYYVGYLKDA